MPKGVALTIGINQIDPGHYGTSGKLSGCEPDAKAVAEMAKALGFARTETLLTRDATRAKVQEAVTRIAGELEPGDLFLLHYSGHGSQMPDTVGSTEEDDQLDETWCLYDAEMLDDELRRLWTFFKKDVRVIIISDSCHSGSVSKGDLEESASRDLDGGAAVVPRELPKEDRDFTYRNNQAAYDNLQRAVNQNIPGADELIATIVLLAACRDDETAKDDGQHGVFTRAMLGVHRQGKFRQDNYTYMQLIRDIAAQIPANYEQHPRMTALDRQDLPISFGRQKPFAVGES